MGMYRHWVNMNMGSVVRWEDRDVDEGSESVDSFYQRQNTLVGTRSFHMWPIHLSKLDYKHSLIRERSAFLACLNMWHIYHGILFGLGGTIGFYANHYILKVIISMLLLSIKIRFGRTGFLWWRKYQRFLSDDSNLYEKTTPIYGVARVISLVQSIDRDEFVGIISAMGRPSPSSASVRPWETSPAVNLYTR